MRVGDRGLDLELAESGWSMQLRNGDRLVAEVDVTPARDADGWRVDGMFGPWPVQQAWTDVVLLSAHGAEETKPGPTTLPRGTVVTQTFRVGRAVPS